ncbi:MAG: trehalose-6-phosphate synthase, partial [Gaiellaceae bacterium]
MPERRPLIVVSNRGPVTFDLDPEGRRVERRGGGGLVTALRGLLDHHDVTWIAAATTDEDRAVAAEGSGEVVLVAPDVDTYHGYYNVVANPMLWFIQHGLWGRALRPDLDRAFHDAWRDYETVNRLFADKVVVELDNNPQAAVFFHDYHLYLAPRYVREARPDAVLAHVVHIPWPVDWTVLPEPMRRAVHEGLLANDVVAFHTARWARNFAASCDEITGGCGRTRVTHHAISIDTAEFDALAQSPAVLREEARIVDRRP